MYSNPWNIEKIAPREIVENKEKAAHEKFSFKIAWWDQVTVTPEERSKIVFNKGILIGLNVLILRGGHAWPNSMVGEILLWKNAQKNEAKNNTSEEINRIIPVFSPVITIFEWCPWIEASRWMSRHQTYARIDVISRIINVKLNIFLLIITSMDSTTQRILFEASRGHGLTSTRWNGLNFFIILIDFCCVYSD